MSGPPGPLGAEDRDAVAAQVEADGYAVVRDVVPPGLVARVRAAVEPSWDGGRTGRLTNAWVALPAVRDLAALPAVLDLLAVVLGGPAVPFQTLDFRVGTEQRAHADTIHFDTVPSGAMCGAWVALEDVGEDQGPLLVYPGSHALPVLTPAAIGRSAASFDAAAYEDHLAALLDEGGFRAVAVPAAAGDVVVWAANLAHGGAPVRRAGSTRWSQVTHYVRRGSVVVTPMRSDVEAGSYLVRDPLVDISTGRAAAPGAGRRVMHGPGGRSRLVAPSERPGVAARVGSLGRSALATARWQAHRITMSRRVPRPD